MLAQNPGLGKIFVWDEFQNESSQSLARRIMVAVLTNGIIGFLAATV